MLIPPAATEWLPTFFDKVLIEEAAEDVGGDIAVGQQDAGEHGQLVALRLSESLEEQQQLQEVETT